MEAKPVTSEVLSRAFHTTLVLTGSAEQSEAAVLESIRCLDLDDDAPGEKLIRGALRAAIARQREIVEQEPGDFDYALSLLPAELRRVLRLPTDSRNCFALRVLAGLPRNVCAPLLNLERRQVDEAAGVAAQLLASIAQEEEQGQAAIKFR
jgi:hypothetical protein